MLARALSLHPAHVATLQKPLPQCVLSGPALAPLQPSWPPQSPMVAPTAQPCVQSRPVCAVPQVGACLVSQEATPCEPGEVWAHSGSFGWTLVRLGQSVSTRTGQKSASGTGRGTDDLLQVQMTVTRNCWCLRSKCWPHSGLRLVWDEGPPGCGPESIFLGCSSRTRAWNTTGQRMAGRSLPSG